MTFIIIILLSLIIIPEIIAFIAYGGFISNELAELYMDLDESKIQISFFNSTIFRPFGYNSDSPYVIKTTICFSSKYYINGIGRIPRWSKLHKKMKQYYIAALKNSIEQ